MKSFSFQVSKSSNATGANSVSSQAVYPEIAGSCPAGHFFNASTSVCERCYGFRYNDGSMTECRPCGGQGIGEFFLKSTKCVPYCSWPFEYKYMGRELIPNSICVIDGGLCTYFSSSSGDTECPLSSCNPSARDSSSELFTNLCIFVNLNANNDAIWTVFSLFIIIFIYCVSRLPQKPNSTLKERMRTLAKLFLLALFPALDFLSDMVYITTSKFHNIGIFLASAFFFVLPM
jgi:hypothetical protein